MSIYIEDHLPVVKFNGLNTAKDVVMSGAVTLPTGTIIGAVPIVLTSTQITTVSDTAVYTVGSRAKDAAGNEYIFLLGVANTVAGDWVQFDSAFATTRLAGTLVGSVAVAMAAVVAAKYGWYQVWGLGSAKVVATGGVAVFTHTVTGQGVATVVTGYLINGANTIAGTGNTVTGTLTGVQLSYPFVTRTSGAY